MEYFKSFPKGREALALNKGKAKEQTALASTSKLNYKADIDSHI